MKVRDFQTDAEVLALVAVFESGTISPSEFSHAAHLAVALAYLAAAPLPEASDRMRRSLRQFVRQHNSSGYHETLTLFWMKLLDHLATTRYSALPLWERINQIVATHGSKWPVEAHYSKEAVSSTSARETWVEPDRIPLPF